MTHGSSTRHPAMKLEGSDGEGRKTSCGQYIWIPAACTRLPGCCGHGHGGPWKWEEMGNRKLADELRYLIGKMQPKIYVQSLKIACDDSREK